MVLLCKLVILSLSLAGTDTKELKTSQSEIATVPEISLQCVCYPTLFTEGNNIKAENHVTYFGYFVLVFGQNGEEKCS